MSDDLKQPTPDHESATTDDTHNDIRRRAGDIAMGWGVELRKAVGWCFRSTWRVQVNRARLAGVEGKAKHTGCLLKLSGERIEAPEKRSLDAMHILHTAQTAR